MRIATYFAVLTLTVLLAAGQADAQGRRGGFGGRGGMGGPGGGPVSKAALLSIDAVAKDVGASQDQLDQVTALRNEARNNRPDRGQFGNFRDMSEDERAEAVQQMQKQRLERQQQEDDKLASILDASQLERLGQISLQIQGASALLNPEVQSKLGLSSDTVQQLTDASRSAAENMRDKMGELFRSGDRESIREQMTKLREETQQQILGVLSASEQKAFEDLQGAKLDLDPDAMRNAMGGGRGQRGNRGPGGQRGGGRPNRDARPELE